MLKEKVLSIVYEELNVHLINENRHILRGKFLTEANVQGKTIINVDIQPEYEPYIGFNFTSWAKFLNASAKTNKIVFLYNGADTLGMVSEEDYKSWLISKGVRITHNAIFYDKGYAFFRYCMDSGIEEQNIVDLVKYMITHNINDSRDINEEMWNSYMKETNHDQQDVRDLLENAGDMINIPDLMEFLQNYNNIVLTGGGVNECLKEVEIALMSLDKPYNVLSQYVY